MCTHHGIHLRCFFLVQVLVSTLYLHLLRIEHSGLGVKRDALFK